MFSYTRNRHDQFVIIGDASELASKIGEIVHVHTQAGSDRLEIVHSVGKAFTRDGARLCYAYPDRSPEARDRIVEAEARFARLAAAKASSVARVAAEASVAADVAHVAKAAPKAKRAPKVAAPRVIDSTLPAAPSVSDAWNDFRDMLLAKAG